MDVDESWEETGLPGEELAAFRDPPFLPVSQTPERCPAAASALTTSQAEEWPLFPSFRAHLAYLVLRAPQDHLEL